MPPVSEVSRRHLLKKALRGVLAEGARGLDEVEEFARVFQTPDDAYAYLRGFGFRVSKGSWPFTPIPRREKRDGCGHGTFYSTREFLCMAVHAEGYPVAELDAWSRVDGDFTRRYSRYGFKRLTKEAVPGEYAGVLAGKGAGLNYVLAAWKNGVPSNTRWPVSMADILHQAFSQLFGMPKSRHLPSTNIRISERGRTTHSNTSSNESARSDGA